MNGVYIRFLKKFQKCLSCSHIAFARIIGTVSTDTNLQQDVAVKIAKALESPTHLIITRHFTRNIMVVPDIMAI